MVKYWRVGIIAFMGTLEYRFDFLFDLLSKFFPALIQVFLWTAIYTNSTHRIIMGYSYQQMILYTVMSIFITGILAVNIHWKISEDIKNGYLSKYFVLPIEYFWYQFFQFLGTKVMEWLMIAVGMGGTLYLFWLKKYVEMDSQRLLIFIPVIVLAFALQYLLYYCMSAIAFWLGECGGVFIVLQVISLIVSGSIFPLDIFGEKVVWISGWLPFYYITYFPTNLFIGRVSNQQIYNALVVMLIWLAILKVFSRIIWEVGKKRYVAMGG